MKNAFFSLIMHNFEKKSLAVHEPWASYILTSIKKPSIAKHNRDIIRFFKQIFLVSQWIAINEANDLYKEQNYIS